MPHDRERLPDADFERIYDRRIRPDVLDGIEKSKTPTAVLVGGQPGAGKSYALARIRANLATTVRATPRFVSAPDHDTAYDELRESLSRLEKELAVDRLQLVARDGRQLYANEVSGTQWVSEPKAVYVLDDFRERKLTARELADSALRWHVLVQRLNTDPAAPSEVTNQAAGWRDEATAKAESDPDAKQLLAWGREAEAFRTMNRVAFLADHPQHARMVERLQ